MHVVVERVHRRVVAELAEARMVRVDEHAVFRRPGLGELEAVKRAGAVQEQQRLDALRPRTTVSTPLTSYASLLNGQRSRRSRRHLPRGARTRGITSSAMSCMFLTTFQCGMSPSVHWMLIVARLLAPLADQIGDVVR